MGGYIVSRTASEGGNKPAKLKDCPTDLGAFPLAGLDGRVKESWPCLILVGELGPHHIGQSPEYT